MVRIYIRSSIGDGAAFQSFLWNAAARHQCYHAVTFSWRSFAAREQVYLDFADILEVRNLHTISVIIVCKTLANRIASRFYNTYSLEDR
jgi:hypothetical protein